MGVPIRVPLVALLVLVLLSAACGRDKRSQFAVRGRLLGVPYHATVVGDREPDREEVREVSQRLQTRLAEIITQTDPETSFSEVARLNRAPANVPVPLSRDVLELLTLAKSVAAETAGAFDVTIQPLQAAWGVHGSEPGLRSPEPGELEELLRRCGLDKIEVRSDAGEAIKRADGLRIDLDAVVAGYAADQLSAVLAEQGWPHHVIQVREQIVSRGVDRLRRPWRVSLQRAERTGAAAAPVSDHALAVAGSGDWLRGPDGDLYSRHIDPRTGHPVRHNVRSAAVLHPRGAEADAYARALMVMGEQDGLEFAERRGLAALLLVEAGGTIEERPTSDFRRIVDGQATGGGIATAALIGAGKRTRSRP